MEPNHYSNREIDMMLESLKNHINEAVVQPLTRIEVQTIKTNGRVSKLENWRNYITGGLAIVSIILVPLILYYINRIDSLQELISHIDHV